MRKLILSNIPNAITLVNLFCGSLAGIAFLQGRALTGAVLLAVAFAADFLDGAVARWLGATSHIGRELDSLADVVSFGLVPSCLFFILLQEQGYPIKDLPLVALPSFLVVVFAAIRLARFNLDTRQEKEFRGLPTPAMSLFVLGYFWAAGQTAVLKAWHPFLLQPVLIYAFIVILCYLMVSEIRLFSLKFDGLRWKGNEIKITFAVASASMLLILGIPALCPIVVAYVVVSIIGYQKTT